MNVVNSAAAMTPPWDIICCSSGDDTGQLLCTHCFNSKISESAGMGAVQNIRFDPIRMIDCAGASHQFHFQVRLLGNGVVLDAVELRRGLPAGYRFQLTRECDDDVFVLLGRLVEKMRCALAVRHIDFQERNIVGNTVRGRIEWDESQDGHLPLVVVDGKERDGPSKVPQFRNRPGQDRALSFGAGPATPGRCCGIWHLSRVSLTATSQVARSSR